MTAFFYFAYGSNMLTERLQKRCPSATVVGVAAADNYCLCFSKRSRDGSGKAALVASPGEKVHGILFEISDTERDNLDKAEGYPNGYSRNDRFQVTCDSDGSLIDATTYLATETEPDLLPYDWYRALVLAGAIQHGLPDSHIEMLCKAEWKSDTNACRPSRLAALHVLERTGFAFLISEG